MRCTNGLLIVRGRMRPRMVMAQAQNIQEQLVLGQVSLGHQPDPRVITHKWLTEWCKKWGVSLQMPNTRYKVKRHALQQHL